MRKVLLAVVLAASIPPAALAERFVAFGPGISLIGQAYQAVDRLDVTAISGSFVDFLGERLGFYVVGALGVPVRATAAGAAIDLSRYDFSLSVDTLMGIGFVIAIAEPVSLVVGIGPSLGFTALIPAAYGDRYYGGAYALGLGAGATLRWRLGSAFCLVATAAGALQLYQLMGVTTDKLLHGAVFMPSIGAGFSF